MAVRSWLFRLLVYGTVVAAVTSCPETHDNESLFLTPFLDKNDTQTARTLSEVHLGKFSSVLYSHAGFITVDRQLGNHLFFWHFPSHQNKDAPLLMWLNGGPAVSSMLGLFWKHGPLEVNREKYGDSYTRRNHTWVGPLSVVYVDNPVGTGFSFSDMGEKGYKLTQEGYTHDLYNFVLQFFKLFPEYKSRQFYIGGQSYAGKYVPALAHRIHKQRHNESAEIPLAGIILGGPYFDPPTESVAFFDYLYALGAISYADMERHKARVKRMYEKFLQGEFSTFSFQKIFQDLLAREELPFVSLDNYVTGKPADYDLMKIIMVSTEIRKAVHVGPSRPFHAATDDVYKRFGPDLFVSTKPQLTTIMDNYKVLIYNGDYDAIVNSVMIEAALLSTKWSMQEQYNNTRRITWNTCDRLKGFYSQTGNFCRVVVHGAGHQTQHDMPDTSLEMVTSFLKYGCIKDQTVSKGSCFKVP